MQLADLNLMCAATSTRESTDALWAQHKAPVKLVESNVLKATPDTRNFRSPTTLPVEEINGLTLKEAQTEYADLSRNTFTSQWLIGEWDSNSVCGEMPLLNVRVVVMPSLLRSGSYPQDA